MDPYAVLGVARDCTTEQVRRAYRQLASACHPDKHPGEGEDQVRLREEAAKQFARVQGAYEILNSAEKREVYDVYGHAGLRAGMEVGEDDTPGWRAPGFARKQRSLYRGARRER